MASPRRILGIDGGGTKTFAVLAALHADGSLVRLGIGRAGDSNPRLSGRSTALANLDEAIRGALAGDPAKESGALRSVDCAVVALAGGGSGPEQSAVAEWLSAHWPFGRIAVVHDAEPLLEIGTPAAWGVTVIAGTGSVAVGRSSAGRTLVRGGWGHWFGDLGSGYDLGRRALAAMADMDDEIGAPTRLRAAILAHFGLEDPRQVTRVLADRERPRREIAALAPLVFEAAAHGDAAAEGIIDQGARELARLAASAATGLGLPAGYPLALAGGTLAGNPCYRDAMLAHLAAGSPAHGDCRVVQYPVLGCLAMARRMLDGEAPAGPPPRSHADLLEWNLAAD